MSAPHRDSPAPGQESVWDYPRPPVVRPSSELVEVHLGGQVIARTTSCLQILETSHPPTYYLSRDCFIEGVLVSVAGSTYCEFKGRADYFDLVVGERVLPRGAWHYPEPTGAYAALRGHVALMPGQVDACYVDGERVRPQEGHFYGGWITSRVSGPFKGAPGTLGW